MVLVMWNFWNSHVIGELQNLFNFGVGIDVVIYAGHNQLKIHSSLLSIFSNYLKEIITDMLSNVDVELPLSISLADFSYESIHSIATFMYYGEVSIPDEYLSEVIHLSNILGIKGLEDLQQTFINVSDEDSVKIFTSDDNKDWNERDNEKETIEDILKNKKIKADIIPVKKSKKKVKKNPPSEILDGEAARPKRVRIKANRKRDRKRKYEKLFDSSSSRLDVPQIKMAFRNEIEKYFNCNVNLVSIGRWPLSSCGISLQTTRDDSCTIPPGIYCSQRNFTRFRREVSYFWLRLQDFTAEEREFLLKSIRDDDIQDFYTGLWQGSTLVDYLNESDITCDQLTFILMMLLVTEEISAEIAIDGYSGNVFSPLFMERIEKGINLYRSTDMLICEITKQLWLSDFEVVNEIHKRGIKRNEKSMNFDKFLHRAVELSSNSGFDKDIHLVFSPEAEEYIEELEKIFQYHGGRIFLPMALYEMRMNDAVISVKFGGLSIEEAACKFMVPRVHLTTRLADYKIENNIKFLRNSGQPRRSGRKSTLGSSMVSAVISIKNGQPLEDAFVQFKINDQRSRRIVEYNINRENPPVNESYEHRFQEALKLVQEQDLNILEAACQWIVNYRTLHARILRLKKITGNTKSGNSLKCGLWSVKDRILRDAILCANKGTPLEEVFEKFKINKKRERKVVKYNCGRMDAPLDIPFRTRLMGAADMVRKENSLITEAACHHVVSTASLWCYLKKTGWSPPLDIKINTQFGSSKPKRKSLCGNWSSTDVKLLKAIQAARSGASLEEVYEAYNIKFPKDRRVVKFNLTVENPPLDTPFKTRFREAISAVSSYKMNVTEASYHYIISYSVLWNYFNNIKKEKIIAGKKKEAALSNSEFDENEGVELSEGEEEDLPHSLELVVNEINGNSDDVNLECERAEICPLREPSVLDDLPTGGIDRFLRVVLAVKKGGKLEETCQKHKVKVEDARKVVNFNRDRTWEELKLLLPLEKRFREAISSVKEKKLSIDEAAGKSCVNPSSLRSYFLNNFAKESVSLPRAVKNSLSAHVKKATNIKKDDILRDVIIAVKEGMDLEEAFLVYNLISRNQRVVRYNINRPDAPLGMPFKQRFQEAVRLVKEEDVKPSEAACRFIVYPTGLFKYVAGMKKGFPPKLDKTVPSDVLPEDFHWSSHEIRLRTAILDARGGMELKEVFRKHKLNLRNQRVVRYNVNRKDAPLDEPFFERFRKAMKDIDEGMMPAKAASQYIINPSTIWNNLAKKRENECTDSPSSSVKRKSVKEEVPVSSSTRMVLRAKKPAKKRFKIDLDVSD